ncbi:hypothetical protein GCM10027515_21390 [Schumannella luteola]|uniref:ADP-ribose pyrophosphatase YjhB (NUDIX family) n=1 Tax=Schumannella luteola TaxID=472059 RepID=A0A852YS33_9MICO|nr:NUDIX domain-containing protein [Schumannella luteola]NYH00066.1 ADP-ribose pyrophosphatase YjhB (NUDIX family) [Schumannella luteola]TPX06622.1 NUDIX domain-containing protein [Schumannella luteola]
MPLSPYVLGIRERIGHDLLYLPGVSAVIERDGSYLLARTPGDDRWGIVGGGMEPVEEPVDALRREVREELGIEIVVGELLGAYGGESLVFEYPNGDVVSYATMAWSCALPDGVTDAQLRIEREELTEVAWLTPERFLAEPHHLWAERMIRDDLARRA